MFHLPTTEQGTLQFLHNKGVLQQTMSCSSGHAMKLSANLPRPRWRCGTCEEELGVRTDGWLHQSKLPLLTAVRFLYSWSKVLTPIEWSRKELNIGPTTTVIRNRSERDVLVVVVEARPKRKRGGPGLIVEIDETLFPKRKNHAGRVLPQLWVFGGICPSTKACFALTVPVRTAATLLAAIRDNIAEGTTIHSDCRKGYKTAELEAAGFSHATVNPKYNFVDAETGVHTRDVERLWWSAKWRNKTQGGTTRSRVDSFLSIFFFI